MAFAATSDVLKNPNPQYSSQAALLAFSPVLCFLAPLRQASHNRSQKAVPMWARLQADFFWKRKPLRLRRWMRIFTTRICPGDSAPKIQYIMSRRHWVCQRCRSAGQSAPMGSTIPGEGGRNGSLMMKLTGYKLHDCCALLTSGIKPPVIHLLLCFHIQVLWISGPKLVS